MSPEEIKYALARVLVLFLFAIFVFGGIHVICSHVVSTPIVAPIERKSLDVPELIIDLDGIILEQMKQKAAPPIHVNPVQCLTDNIYYEAGFEPYEGQLAVAQVTINRAHDDPKAICNVVYFKKVNPATGKKEAAFSWTLGYKWRAHGMNRTAYRECYAMAKAVLTLGLRSDIIDGSVEHYHADYISPRWKNNYQVVAQIGAHIFYR